MSFRKVIKRVYFPVYKILLEAYWLWITICSRTKCILFVSYKFPVPGSRQLSISDFVVPKVVEVGNDAELKCSYELDSNSSEKNLFVKWWWSPPPSSSGRDKKQLYQRGPDHKPRSLQHKISK